MRPHNDAQYLKGHGTSTTVSGALKDAVCCGQCRRWLKLMFGVIVLLECFLAGCCSPAHLPAADPVLHMSAPAHRGAVADARLGLA